MQTSSYHRFWKHKTWWFPHNFTNCRRVIKSQKLWIGSHIISFHECSMHGCILQHVGNACWEHTWIPLKKNESIKNLPTSSLELTLYKLSTIRSFQSRDASSTSSLPTCLGLILLHFLLPFVFLSVGDGRLLLSTWTVVGGVGVVVGVVLFQASSMGGSKVISSTATAAPAHGAVVASCTWGVLVLLLLSAGGTVQCLHSSSTPAGLSEDFYAESCPEVFDIVSAGVALGTLTDIRLPASLLRVSFHDCWIGVIGFPQDLPLPHYQQHRTLDDPTFRLVEPGPWSDCYAS